MMAEKQYYTMSEVTRIFGISEYTICRIEAEGFIQVRRQEGSRKIFAPEDLERIRVILALSRELGVNWAGIEVILHMRERMLEMQQQVDEIMNHLHRQMQNTLAERQMEQRQRLRPKMDIIKVLDEEQDGMED
jgi:MerR family transcriptional regulator, heat shock protein HspR